ncbi:helix-turn-helix domain-containing protein [Actinoplanes rectilineatus]|uniref:helix-turn-helix domain-containing protein n=1 Tax=Actinoplanes rectilineatus TaxID=113571 RepID=UPI0005F2A8D3|nr:helix-turn-helix transcriptional regulator [Actinoplanes rectilineatus]
MAISPYVYRLVLAERMLDLRQQAGLKTEELSSVSRIQRQKISHIETARQRVDPEVIHQLLAHLDVQASQLDSVMRLAAGSAEPGWWERFDDEMGPRQALAAAIEQGTCSIFQFQPFLMPGLLQTRNFAAVRAVADRSANSRRFSKARMLEAREKRQAILDGPDAPRFEVIIDEAVLHRRSAPADVMHEQIEHIIGAALNKRSVTVRILPFEAVSNEHAQARTAFTQYAFIDPEALDITMVDTNVEDHLYQSHDANDKDKLTVFTGLASELREAALSPAESIERLTQAAEAFLSRR